VWLAVGVVVDNTHSRVAGNEQRTTEDSESAVAPVSKARSHNVEAVLDVEDEPHLPLPVSHQVVLFDVFVFC
jgi:hypothetical protein